MGTFAAALTMLFTAPIASAQPPQPKVLLPETGKPLVLDAGSQKIRVVLVACGLAAVSRLAGRGARATLLVEEDYRMKGRLGGTSESPVISPDVDVRDVMDDAVDAVIEKVLASGGNVLFTPGGSLRDEKRIVLMLDGVERA